MDETVPSVLAKLHAANTTSEFSIFLPLACRLLNKRLPRSILTTPLLITEHVAISLAVCVHGVYARRSSTVSPKLCFRPQNLVAVLLYVRRQPVRDALKLSWQLLQEIGVEPVLVQFVWQSLYAIIVE